MIGILPVVSITLSSAAALVFFYFAVLRKIISQGESGSKRRVKAKDRSSILKVANRRLARNPKDAEALLSLADLYYEEENFETSLIHYQKLINLCATNEDLDEFEITVRHAISALRIKAYDDAYKNFMIARSYERTNFELDYNHGYLEFIRKNYERAAVLLQSASKQRPDFLQTYKYLGISYSRLGHHTDAIDALKKWLEVEPADKEASFAVAQSYFHLNQFELADKLLSQLRVDPAFGPKACLFSGTIHINKKDYDRAIENFEIGLRHGTIPPKIAHELKYRLAAAFVRKQDLESAVRLLREICEVDPKFRDANDLLSRCKELNANKNLKTFLMASESEFSNLCRKLVHSHFGKVSTKILDLTSQKNEFTDILAQVTTSKWEDLILFRFIRTGGSIGDLVIRDFHGRIKDCKAGRAVCMTPGTFNNSAITYVEARLIDLIEKEGLLKLFKRL